jgi:hypothetical protein
MAPTRVAPGARVPVVARRAEAGGVVFIENSALLGEVAGLKPDPRSFLSVRAGPGVAYRELDRLRQGAQFIALAPDFEWVGVVYLPAALRSAPDIGRACGLDETAAQSAPPAVAYAGLCKSGWVNRKWTRMLVD